MLGNVLFSLIFKIGGLALGLGLVLFFAWKAGSKYIKKNKHKKHTKRVLWIIWLAAILLSVLSMINSTGPRVTIQDHGKRSPNYEKSEVQDLSPNELTDEERVQQNKVLMNENKQ